jgi:hypothetical protein
VPDAYASADAPILAGLSAAAADVELLVALGRATSRRALVQQDAVPSGIHADELVFGVPEWHIVNAAFCYPNPLGARFNGADRGAWYAGREVATSLAEVSFHKAVELAETDFWDISVVYRDFLADIHGTFHDLRDRADGRTRACLDPHSYQRSQQLAHELLGAGSLGVVYPAVRHSGGEVVACFRPAAVAHVRRGRRYRLSWKGPGDPTVRSL